MKLENDWGELWEREWSKIGNNIQKTTVALVVKGARGPANPPVAWFPQGA